MTREPWHAIQQITGDYRRLCNPYALGGMSMSPCRCLRGGWTGSGPCRECIRDRLVKLVGDELADTYMGDAYMAWKAELAMVNKVMEGYEYKEDDDD